MQVRNAAVPPPICAAWLHGQFSCFFFRQNFSVASAPILRQNKSAALEHNPGRRFSLSQNHRRAQEGRSPFAFSSYPAACTAGAGGFASGNPIFSPQRKSFPCRFRAWKFAGFQRKLAGMAVGAGFRGFSKGKSATAQIENLRRDARRGRYSPIPSCHKTAGEREEAGTFSHFRRTRRHVGWAGGFASENPIFPPNANRFLAVSAPGNSQDFNENWREWP